MKLAAILLLLFISKSAFASFDNERLAQLSRELGIIIIKIDNHKSTDVGRKKHFNFKSLSKSLKKEKKYIDEFLLIQQREPSLTHIKRNIGK